MFMNFYMKFLAMLHQRILQANVRRGILREVSWEIPNDILICGFVAGTPNYLSLASQIIMQNKWEQDSYGVIESLLKKSTSVCFYRYSNRAVGCS